MLGGHVADEPRVGHVVVEPVDAGLAARLLAQGVALAVDAHAPPTPGDQLAHGLVPHRRGALGEDDARA